MSPTALITGAGGFIGKYVSKSFTDSGWRVIALSRGHRQLEALPDVSCDVYVRSDLSNRGSELRQALREYKPNVCIHLAGPASVPDSFKEPSDDFTRHLFPFLNLLNDVRLSNQATKVLLISSAAVYGDPSTLPVREDQELSPLSPYGYHKLHQELLLKQYINIHGLRGCIARVFSTYGAGLKRLAVWDITKRALAGDRTLHGTGKESRDYLHVSDVARGLVCIAERAPFAGESINVASGQETKITHLAETIYKIVGIRGGVKLIGDNQQGRNKEPMRWHADIRQLRCLGFEPNVDLESGLSSTVEWIRSNE